MKNFISKFFAILILCKLFAPNAEAAYSTYQAQLTQGTGISITGNGTTQSPYVITNSSPANTPSFNNSPSVTLNSSSQISSTKSCRCTYAVSVVTSVNLLNLNSSGKAYLEISPNNSTWTEINRAGVSRTLSVGITLAINDTSFLNLQGEVPAGYYRRIRTSGTVIYNSGQEVQY